MCLHNTTSYRECVDVYVKVDLKSAYSFRAQNFLIYHANPQALIRRMTVVMQALQDRAKVSLLYTLNRRIQHFGCCNIKRNLSLLTHSSVRRLAASPNLALYLPLTLPNTLHNTSLTRYYHSTVARAGNIVLEFRAMQNQSQHAAEKTNVHKLTFTAVAITHRKRRTSDGVGHRGD